MDGVISSLQDEKLLMAYQDAIQAALFIDCIWLKNGRSLPRGMEVKCTTGSNSGLSRMKNFYDKFPPFPTRYIIVAADDDRDKFIKEASKKQFRDFNPKLFRFSAIEELYSLCQDRRT